MLAQSSLTLPSSPPGCRHGEARGASQVIEALRQVILHLYDAYLAPDGKAVNYKSLAKDPTFKDYVNATAELQKVGRLLGAWQWQEVSTALSSGWASRCNGRRWGIRVALQRCCEKSMSESHHCSASTPCVGLLATVLALLRHSCLSWLVMCQSRLTAMADAWGAAALSASCRVAPRAEACHQCTAA